MSIYIDLEAFEELRKRCMEVGPREVAFYALGFIAPEGAYLVDIVEFNYRKMTCVEVASDPLLKGFLSIAVPPVARLIGTVHRHLADFVRPSQTDLKTFRDWSKTFVSYHIIIDSSCSKLMGFRAFEGEVEECEVIVDDVRSKVIEEMVEGLVTFPLVYLRGMGKLSILASLQSRLRELIGSAARVVLQGRGYKLILSEPLVLRIEGMRLPLVVFTDEKTALRVLNEVLGREIQVMNRRGNEIVVKVVREGNKGEA